MKKAQNANDAIPSSAPPKDNAALGHTTSPTLSGQKSLSPDAPSMPHAATSVAASSANPTADSSDTMPPISPTYAAQAHATTVNIPPAGVGNWGKKFFHRHLARASFPEWATLSNARVIFTWLLAAICCYVVLENLDRIQPFISHSKFLRTVLNVNSLDRGYPISNLAIFCACLLLISHVLLVVNCLWFILDVAKLGRNYDFGNKRLPSSLLGACSLLCGLSIIISSLFAFLVALTIIVECLTVPTGMLRIATVFRWNEPVTVAVLVLFIVIDLALVSALSLLKRQGVCIRRVDRLEAWCSILVADLPALVGVGFIWMITHTLFSASENPAARQGGDGEFMTFSAGAIGIHLLITQFVYMVIRLWGHKLVGDHKA